MDSVQAKNIILRFPRLVAGLLIGSLSIVFQIEANLGYGSWTTLSHGVAKNLGITMGQSSIIISGIIILIDMFAKEKIGLGMVCNVFLMGGFQDVIRSAGIVPTAPGALFPDGSINWYGVLMGLVMLFASMVLMGFCTVLYVGAGLGAGPRDTLMVVAMKLTGKSIAVCRNALECSALAVGWLLGGSVGIGTVVLSLCLGPVLQFVCGKFKFNPKSVRHITIDELPGILSGKLRIDSLVNPPPMPAKQAVGAMTAPKSDTEN